MPYKNKNHALLATRLRKYTMKMKCQEYLGGKCKHCGESDFFKLCFHHLNPLEKETIISKQFNCKFETIKSELDKCILLCHNCHKTLHYEQEKNLNNNSYNRRKSKEIFLELLKQFSCDLCGYNSCIAALEFHHIDEKNKDYDIENLISLQYTSIENLSKIIISELNKCQILCSNCHVKHHSNTEFYDLHKNEIEMRCKNYKPMIIKSDTKKVIELYNSDISLVEIAKELNCSPNTIGDKIKRLIQNGKLLKREKTWVNQYK